jgi:hypothetical protein
MSHAHTVATVADLTPELLAQLEADAQWFSTQRLLDRGYEGGYRLRRLLSAASPLVAAARERDQLRAELDDVRRAVNAPGDSGTFEAVARMHDEVTRLREEAERLRNLARRALSISRIDGESLSEADAIRDEIERKS